MPSIEQTIEREQTLDGFDAVGIEFCKGWTERDVVDWLYTYEFFPVEKLDHAHCELALQQFAEREEYWVCALIRDLIEQDITRIEALKRYE